jgi:hypothetical protein
MARLRVLPIVEGHGEDAAIRILLERIGSELPGCEHVEVLRPLRWPKTKLLQDLELKRAVELACLKLAPLHSPEHPLVLILLDADEDPPCKLGPELLANARQARPDVDIVCVLGRSSTRPGSWLLPNPWPSMDTFASRQGNRRRTAPS